MQESQVQADGALDPADVLEDADVDEEETPAEAPDPRLVLADRLMGLGHVARSVETAGPLRPLLKSQKAGPHSRNPGAPHDTF